MFILFLALTIVFTLVLVTGFVWGLIVRGKTTKESGPEIGAELMRDKMDRDSVQEGKVPVAGKAFFVGKGFAVEREAEYSYAEIKQMLRAGDVRQALPALLVAAGMIGLTFFLSLILLVKLPNKIYGLVILAFSLYCVYLIIAGFIRKDPPDE
jgi:hypothetical protein